ncbi:electron transfer flavoprotein subunit beta/FixA family protein [Alkalihalobacillus oceani]|uniref:Electron transfer flavoprotein subunit beta n=1 Tax=Halalkalibacter oceani TaxID=1653776 RepID=A0A9X2INR9_9BACI|nr:electron transfer flavoprotein subunit beta/FixA family protein [Halalkalibacter oceani]MCM3715204.1 electron transfer flavoprotein subunit beta/FixA family protein [Halalkalibacter oceani]
MNIYVVMKQTLDTEERIAIDQQQIVTEGAELIINPYDEYAIEEAVQLKEAHGGDVTVVTVGGSIAESALRTALAIGADKADLIEVDEQTELDSAATSMLFAAYFQDREYDLIVAGNVSIDNGSGQVGPRLAEELAIPAVTTATKLTVNENKATVERDVEGDLEIVEVPLPALITAQQGLNEPRYPSLPGIMKAKKKPLTVLEPEELEVAVEALKAKTKTIKRYLPPEKKTGVMLDGDIQQQVSELVSRLTTEKNIL